MKRVLVYSLCAFIALGAFAQSKTDIGSRARIRAKQSPVEMVKTGDGQLKVARRTVSRSAAEEMLRAFITVKPGTDVSELEAAGVNVQRMRGNIALAEFPRSSLAAVEELECVVKIRTEAPVEQKMDLARKFSGIDKIHNGENLPQAYTGKGIVTGIVDGGFDPNHINFKDENGDFRIKQFTVYRYGQSMTGQSQVEKAQISGDRLETIDTDAYDTYHGTHTAGIMAGSYKGRLTAGNAIDFVTGEVKEIDNPYYGVATGADIVLAGAEGGQLSDYFIALGVESILDYAYDNNQPAAINLSLGSNVGPHDGSSDMCQYLDLVVDDDQVNAIVCVAAGNEGDQPIALTKTFTDDDLNCNSFINASVPQIGSGTEAYKNPRAGVIYIYSDSDKPFELQAVIYSKSRKTVAARLPLVVPEGEVAAQQYWVSDDSWKQDETDQLSLQFSKYFNGYIGLASEPDPASGRYFGVVDVTCWDNTTANGNGNYILGFQIKGTAGQRIDVYGDGSMTYFSGEGVDGYMDGGFDGTINDIACGKNTIIVGSYTTRNYWASLDGGVYGYWDDVFPIDDMTPFTSFGTLIDGRELPHICAPGACIISSSNKYYLDAEESDDIYLQARVASDNRMHDFHYSMGTSMAAPVVTGTVALWLEANPQLKASEAREIMLRTAVKDDKVTNSANPVQWGAGKLNAYEGLKQVIQLKESGLEGITTDMTGGVQVNRSGDRCFDIFVPGATSVNAQVYNMVGSQVLGASASGSEVSIDASGLQPGVYIVRVNNHSIKLSI